MRHILAIAVISMTLLPAWVAAQPADRDEAAPMVEKRPWIGVSVSPAPVVLRHQLKLADGVGLIVEFVQPNSPAAAAGLQPYDLLVKLDDQWLVNAEQFAVLVRMHHAGDQVKLSFVREGAEHTATAKLVDHEFSRLPGWDAGTPWPFAPDSAPTGHSKPGEHNATRVLTWLDGHRQVSVTTTNDRTALVVKDTDTGRVLFDGPIDTEDERKSLPPDVRKTLDSLMKISSAFGAPSGSGNKPPPAHGDAGQQP
jgi:membrane-associated protease RseP (regulator of RpoE activity)